MKALHAMGRQVASAKGDQNLQDASRHLAAAISDAGQDGWRYALRYARDQAVISNRAGLLAEFPSSTGIPETAPEQGPPERLAAAGDLKCDGFSAGCQNGGSRGSTAMYRGGGKNLCYECIIKFLGVKDENNAAKQRTISPYLLNS